MPPGSGLRALRLDPAKPQDEPVSNALAATSRATKSVTQSTVWAEIEKAAADLDAPTEEQRIDKLLMTEKGRLLRATYYRTGPVGRQLSSPSSLDKAHLEVVDAAKRKGENSHEYAMAMATRFAALGHTDQAQMWRAYARALSST